LVVERSFMTAQIEHWSTLEGVAIVLESEQTRTTSHSSISEQISRLVTPAWLTGKLKAGGQRNTS
jgi:hypothetical protein